MACHWSCACMPTPKCRCACACSLPENEVHPLMQVLRHKVTLQSLPLNPDELIGAVVSPGGQHHISQLNPRLQSLHGRENSRLPKNT